MDRIDIWVEVPKIEHEKLLGQEKAGASSADIRKRVTAAREQQNARLGPGRMNAHMSVKDIDEHVQLDAETKKLLDTSAAQLNLSPRVYHKIVKLARTIADLDGQVEIKQEHILEALQYRPKNIT